MDERKRDLKAVRELSFAEAGKTAGAGLAAPGSC
jgi:hypothetical protein